MSKTLAAIGRAFLGAGAGGIIGQLGCIIVISLAGRREPAMEFRMFLASVCLGAFLGSLISATVGQRCVSALRPSLPVRTWLLRSIISPLGRTYSRGIMC